MLYINNYCCSSKWKNDNKFNNNLEIVEKG